MTKSPSEDPPTLLKVAEEAAITGGKHIKEEYFKETNVLSIKEKKKNDFVTNLDLESEQIIRKIIKNYNSNAKIIGEEEGEEGSDEEIEWYVDPLDGTGAFLRGNLAFVSVSVSAIKTDTKQVLVGAVYNPFTEILYSASLSGHVTPNIENKTNKVKKLKDARILLDISEDHPFEIRSVLTPDNEQFGRILRFDGSFAQHMCLLASGTLDGGIFWGNGTKGTFWDLASALLICKSAGLEVTDLLGNDISKESSFYDQIVVGPKKLHEELLYWIKQISTKNNIKINSSYKKKDKMAKKKIKSDTSSAKKKASKKKRKKK